MTRRLVLAAPAALLLALAGVLVLSHGGYSPTSWYPAGLFVLALAALLLVAGATPRWSRSFAWALAAYAAYVGWSYLSILWAEVPGLAWDGANRSLVYGLVLLLVGMRRWAPGEMRVALALVLGLIAAVAVGVLVVGAGSSPEDLFLEGRLADPMGYANATPNLWLMGCLAGLWLAIDRAVPWPARGAAAGAAALLAQMSLLSQSRGAIVSFTLVSLLFVALAPRRWAALGAVATAVGVTLATSGPVLRVHDASASQEIGGLLADATRAVAAGSAVVLSLWLALAAGDAALARRGRLSRNTRAADRALAGLGAAVVVAALVAMGNPATWIGDRWQDFKTSGYEEVDRPGQTRLTGSLGSQRYDVYRVALREFADAPILGVGVDSYGPGYLLEGRTNLNPRYAHSLAMALLAETGIVGALLFGAFVAFLLAALVRAARAPGARGPVVGGSAAAAMFLAGSMFDWLWQFPALAFLGLGLLAAAANVAEPAAVDVAEPGGAGPRRDGPLWSIGGVVRRGAGGLLALAAALSLALPGIAERFTSAAYEAAPTDPRLTLRRLDRAAELNPLSVRPLLARAVVLRRLGEIDAARGALARAAEREPDNWFIPFESALLDARQRRFDDALANLRRAEMLNPRQVVIDLVARAARAGRDYGADRAERQLAEQTSRKLQPTG